MVATAAPGLTAPYAGIATRGIGLAVDAAIANLIVLVIAALVGLVGSLFGELRPQWLVALLAAVGWLLVIVSYFALFWSVAGQTPGMRLMRLRVIDGSGEPPHLVRALVRVGGLALAIIPLGAGFLPVLFDSRRRGVHDLLARTTVIHVPPG
jgi:uncharacterized RDD family membrane protein YckC